MTANDCAGETSVFPGSIIIASRDKFNWPSRNPFVPRGFRRGLIRSAAQVVTRRALGASRPAKVSENEVF